MQSERLDFYYFTGTGNTYRVVRRMARTFQERGVDVRLMRIERGTPVTLRLGSVLGLGFPVAYQSTYTFLWDYFRSLPEGRSAEVFMVDTMAGYSGGIVEPLGRLLLKKGYRLLAAREIQMPLNFWLVETRLYDQDEMIARGERSAEQYAVDLLEGKARWRLSSPVEPLMYGIFRLYEGLLYTGWNQRWFKVRHLAERCDGCQRCVRACPVGNIDIREGGPIFLDHCEFCQMCLAVCPHDANQFVLNRGLVYRATDEPFH